MREFFRPLVVLACVVPALPAPAQQLAEPNALPVALSPALRPAAPSTPRPYPAVAVKFTAMAEDASFESFRRELASVAKARIYWDLARLVAAQGFFWDRDFQDGFDGRQPAVDNLAAAVRLEHRNGRGWDALATFAGEATVAPFTGRPGIVCTPAEPSFDEVDFDRLMDLTRSSVRDWAVPRTEQTPVRIAARSNAKVKDTLGLTLVRVINYLAKDHEPESLRAAWVRVMTPAGKVGYVAPGALMPLGGERLCYGRDGFGRWRIAGFVGAGD